MMLKLLETPGVVELVPREPDPVDHLFGDPELAAMLDIIRRLLKVGSVAMHLVTAAGMLGERLAGVGAQALEPGTDICADRLPGVAGIWLPGSGQAGPIHLSLLEPRARDRIALLCRPDIGEAGDRRMLERQLADYLPLIERSVAQWARAHVEQLRLREQHAMFDTLGFGLLVIDIDCRLHSINAAARAQLGDLNMVSTAHERLTIHHLEDAMRFQVSLQHMLNAAARPGETVTVALRRRTGPPLLLVISAMSVSATGRQLAMVQLVDPAAELALPLETLVRHYDLTQVEGRLVEQLVRGKTLGEAAIAMRLKEQTARTYLKHVFQKTGLRRQVELIRMVLAGAVPRLCAGS
jgi:DNA-binding CsgD family transcriptional regulator